MYMNKWSTSISFDNIFTSDLFEANLEIHNKIYNTDFVFSLKS